jgi:hypothetical protein
MQLRFLGIDTGKDGCPTLYASDRETYFIQGWRVSDPEIRASLNFIGGETCVEVPRRLMTFLEPDTSRMVPSEELEPFIYTNKGTYVVKGVEVTDPEVLGQMDIPAHETVVEVPRRLMRNLAGEVACNG